MAPKLFSCFGSRRSDKDSSSENASKVHDNEPASALGPVMLEMFTSQGCTTSPQAELLISRIGGGESATGLPPVVVLAYHVDHWDYLGWKDPFGSSLWSARQKAFIESLQKDSIYTPQVVIQGRVECMGNNEEALIEEIGKAPRFPGPAFQASFQRKTPEILEVSLSGALRTKVDGKGMDIMVALYESGIVTEIQAGENKGRVMKNDFVVRKLEKMCNVHDVSAKKTVSGTVNFGLWEGFDSSKCGIVVFMQNSSLENFGSQQFQMPENL